MFQIWDKRIYVYLVLVLGILVQDSYFVFRGGVYYGFRVVGKRTVKGFDVFEFEYVFLDKGFSDFLVGLGDEEFVVVVCFFREVRGEVYGGFQVYAFFVGRVRVVVEVVSIGLLGRFYVFYLG